MLPPVALLGAAGHLRRGRGVRRALAGARMGTEIQERMGAEHADALLTALPDQLAWLEAIAEHAQPAAVWQPVPGEDGIRLVWVNQAYCELLGCEARDVLGTKAGHGMVESRRREVVRRVAEQVLEGGTAYEEVELLRADGTQVRVDGTYFAVFGEAPALVATYRDLTDRERAERNEQWAETILRRGHDLLMV
ncbi:hypothetical protein B7486_68015, partial [cyanobacterium TDX16]